MREKNARGDIGIDARATYARAPSNSRSVIPAPGNLGGVVIIPPILNFCGKLLHVKNSLDVSRTAIMKRTMLSLHSGSVVSANRLEAARCTSCWRNSLNSCRHCVQPVQRTENFFSLVII